MLQVISPECYDLRKEALRGVTAPDAGAGVTNPDTSSGGRIWTRFPCNCKGNSSVLRATHVPAREIPTCGSFGNKTKSKAEIFIAKVHGL